MRSRPILLSILISAAIIVTSVFVTNEGKYHLPYDIKYHTLSKSMQKQVDCLTENILFEAGKESKQGQVAVALVTLNRVASRNYASDVCGVVHQKTNGVCQFSWVCENKGEPNKNSYRYKVAQQVAFDVMATDKHKDVIPNSVLFFHNLTVTPLWPYAEVVKIGNHIFYSKAKKKNLKPKKKPKTSASIDI